MHHTVVISDIHLCEVEPEEGLWMRYRQRRFSPAGEVAAMVDELCRRTAGDRITFVLNGDVFDFDAPRVIDNRSVFHDLPRRAEHAVPAAHAILRDHPAFTDALARLVAAGHTLVLVSGNHDVLLTLPEVREAIVTRIAERAAELAGTPEADVRARTLFRAWFHKTADGVVVEHGHLYDAYCTFRHPMAPFGPKPGEIPPNMGSLATRHLVSRMGFFNPHVDASYMLSALGYCVHWARYYMFSRRSLAFAWFFGALRTLTALVRHRHPSSRERRHANLAAASRETGSPLLSVARHARLFARPADEALFSVVRELWVDRIALLGLSALIATLCLLFATGHSTFGALLGPALLVAYEAAVPKHGLEVTWQRVQAATRHVARVERARAVVFGHTHHAVGDWEDGQFFGNSGSWSAAFRDLECTKPLSDERPLIWLTSDGTPEGELTGGLFAFKDGAIEPRRVRERG